MKRVPKVGFTKMLDKPNQEYCDGMTDKNLIVIVIRYLVVKEHKKKYLVKNIKYSKICKSKPSIYIYIYIYIYILQITYYKQK